MRLSGLLDALPYPSRSVSGAAAAAKKTCLSIMILAEYARRYAGHRMKCKAFIIFTHFLNDRILRFLKRAQQELSSSHDIYVIGFFESSASIPQEFQDIPCAVVCTPADLKDLAFPGVAQDPNYKIIPGDNDMPILWFALRNPEYLEFWVFEGDVDYTGSIGDLIRHLDQSDADLLLTWLRGAKPGWAHFKPRSLPQGWPAPEESRLCGLLSVYRTSRSLIDEVVKFYSSGGRGHSEWVWPQVAARRGKKYFDLLDFPFEERTLYRRWPQYRERSLGTFRYRPTMSKPGRRKNTLWHPVKDRPVNLLSERIVPAFRFLYWEIFRGAGRAWSAVLYAFRSPR